MYNVASGSGAKLEVVKYAEDDFSFNWTKEGSRHQIETTSILTFQSVSEEDFGYYRCEVQVAKSVVLTVCRALYREESNTCCINEPSPSGIMSIFNSVFERAHFTVTTL